MIDRIRKIIPKQLASEPHQPTIEIMNLKFFKTGISLVLLGAFVSACATKKTQPPPAAYESKPAPAPAVAPAPASGAYGPSHTTFEEKGVKYVRGSVAFTDGSREGGGLLLEKVVPAEVVLGQPFEYAYTIVNRNDCPLENVVVTDRVTENFKTSQAEPAAAEVRDGVARWNLGTIEAKGKRTIRVRGTATAEGTITTCGWATFIPVLCEPVRVTKPALELVKTAQPEVLLCDKIPMTLKVRNAGSSVLTEVKVVDTLPEGLTSDNKRELVFDAGTLKPGESKDFAFAATAARVGSFVNVAKATSAQGVTAEAKASTVVRQPVLSIACTTPESQIIGRPIEICFVVSNKGNAPSAATVLEVQVPEGLKATANSNLKTQGGKAIFEIGTLAPNASERICATLVAETAGSYEFKGSVRGTCAQAVTTACTTVTRGVPAILLEVVDVEDPIEVGKDVTYVIEVTNQGTAPDSNIRLVCTLEDSQQFVSGTGITAVSAEGRRITMAPVATLAPKAKATWRVTVRALSAANVRFKTSMTSAELTRPVEETESTNQY